jgi:hypothetical protein
LIFETEEFTKDFLAYIEDDLFQDYKAEIAKKMLNIALKFEEWNLELGDEINKKEFPEKLMSKIKEYSIKNSRCKLAWCSREISEAISRVKILVDNVKGSLN